MCAIAICEDRKYPPPFYKGASMVADLLSDPSFLDATVSWDALRAKYRIPLRASPLPSGGTPAYRRPV